MERVSAMGTAHDRGVGQKIVFYLFKLPFILVAIIIGFLFEFLLELPFMVMCKLDRTLDDQQSGHS